MDHGAWLPAPATGWRVGLKDNATRFLLGTSSLGLAFYCLFVPAGETLIALQEFAHAQPLDDMY
jgi:hypothetical protein